MKPTLTEEQIIEALKSVKDPEVGYDVWTMGLIYKITIDEKKKHVHILMTYTTPFCPWGPQLNDEIETALTDIGVKKTELEVTFDPPYKMPDDMRAMLGL